jgi:hypothetical protein
VKSGENDLKGRSAGQVIWTREGGGQREKIGGDSWACCSYSITYYDTMLFHFQPKIII